MRTEILKRCLFGAPIGLALSVLITIVISVILGDGNFHAVVPELVTDMGSEINAVMLHTALSMLSGAAWAGASLVLDAEGWSLLKMTLVHLIIASAATFPVAYFARWMPHTLSGVLIYIGIFVFIYAGIWVSQYSAMKKRIRELNERIQKK